MVLLAVYPGEKCQRDFWEIWAKNWPGQEILILNSPKIALGSA